MLPAWHVGITGEGHRLAETVVGENEPLTFGKAEDADLRLPDRFVVGVGDVQRLAVERHMDPIRLLDSRLRDRQMQ